MHYDIDDGGYIKKIKIKSSSFHPFVGSCVLSTWLFKTSFIHEEDCTMLNVTLERFETFGSVIYIPHF